MSSDYDRITDKSQAEAAGNDIGKMMASGVGVGLDQNSYLAVTAMENVYVQLENVTKNAAKNAENLAKKTQTRELKNLKNSLELEFITEQEYYEKLKQYRDENLTQGTDAWFQCTEEIVEYNKRLLDEAAKAEAEYQKLMEKAALAALELQQKLQNNLKSNDPWAVQQKITIKGVNPDGSDIVYRKDILENFDEELVQLERYRDAIIGLKNLGTIPDGVFAEIGKMDVSAATAAAEVLLSADKETLARFTEGYNARDALTGELAAAFNPLFNKEQLQAVGIDCAEAFNSGYFEEDGQQKTAFVKALEESFEEIPPQYYEMGTVSGNAFGESFNEKLREVMQDAREYITSSINDFAARISAATPSFAAASSGTSNVFNTSYTFNASKDTTTMQLATAKNAATLERLRGGN